MGEEQGMVNYERPYVIAEIGCNHKGDMQIAKEMISGLVVTFKMLLMKEGGVDLIRSDNNWSIAYELFVSVIIRDASFLYKIRYVIW